MDKGLFPDLTVFVNMNKHIREYVHIIYYEYVYMSSYISPTEDILCRFLKYLGLGGRLGGSVN